MMYLIYLVFVLFKTTDTYVGIPKSLNIRITSLQRCSNINYLVEVSDVAVKVRNAKIYVSGTLIATEDLVSPIAATIVVKRNEWGLWVKVPCLDKVGSCTFDDLCIYGISPNITCPKKFMDNNVPCRCPIPKGTYTIKPSSELEVDMNYSSIYTGNYWAQITASHNGNILSCYDVYFEIETPFVTDIRLDNRNEYILTVNRLHEE